MAPIEAFVDGKFAGLSSSGPSEIKLPDPPESPGGEIEWSGDESGFGQMIAGPENQCEIFQFTEAGQKASYKVSDGLSSSLFKTAANTTQEIEIKRV